MNISFVKTDLEIKHSLQTTLLLIQQRTLIGLYLGLIL